MNALAPTIGTSVESLAGIVDRAATALSLAKSAAEVLDAIGIAEIAYDVAKKTARLAKAKTAHDDVIAAALRAQADALEIQSDAKRRLADEYDSAQERGEVASPTDGKLGRSQPERLKPTAADIGLTRKQIHEARVIRDAEKAQPGIVRRMLDQALSEGVEPTKARLRRAVLKSKEQDRRSNVLPLKRHTSSAQPTAPAVVSRKDAICARVAEAIMALSGMPPAEEVAAWLVRSDKAAMISERIDRASPWLSAFDAAWRKQNC